MVAEALQHAPASRPAPRTPRAGKKRGIGCHFIVVSSLDQQSVTNRSVARPAVSSGLSVA
jgi:hypothetical protein